LKTEKDKETLKKRSALVHDGSYCHESEAEGSFCFLDIKPAGRIEREEKKGDAEKRGRTPK